MHGGLLQVREYLEKHYQELSGMEAVKMAIKALTETVEAGSKNIEVCTTTPVSLPFSNSFVRASQPAEMVSTCSKNIEVCSTTPVPFPFSNSFVRASQPAEMVSTCSYVQVQQTLHRWQKYI